MNQLILDQRVEDCRAAVRQREFQQVEIGGIVEKLQYVLAGDVFGGDTVRGRYLLEICQDLSGEQCEAALYGGDERLMARQKIKLRLG